MKRTYNFTFVSLFFLIFAAPSFSQPKEDVKAVMGKIIEMSKSKSYDAAAKYIAYRPDDKKMEYKIPVLTNKEQMNYIQRLLKRIGALADVSASYNIGAVTPQDVSGIKFEKVSVDFISGSQKLNSSFLFINIQGSYLLAEIE